MTGRVSKLSREESDAYFKLRPRGYTTGSAVGFVREAHAEAKGRKRFRGVVLPPSIPANELPQNREVIYMRKDQKERRSRKPSKA